MANCCERVPELVAPAASVPRGRPELRGFIHDPAKHGARRRRLAAILDETKLRRVLARMLDEEEFLSPYGIRSLSRYHARPPLRLRTSAAQEYRVGYLPAESDTGMFGGNSNWRGPIWMPVNALIIRALLQYHAYYGDDFTVECPTGSGRQMTLYQVAEEISAASERDLPARRRRPATGLRRHARSSRRIRTGATSPFYEYFHGDNGAGLGASHQTGWTGVIAPHHPSVRDARPPSRCCDWARWALRANRRQEKAAGNPSSRMRRCRVAAPIRRSTRSTPASG